MPSGSGKKAAQPAPQEQGSPRILVYALLGVTLFMGLYLHAYAMPQLTYFADGLTMPGARITGYSAADILALQNALEDDAAGQLNFLHKTAGIIFPALLFLATWAVMGLLVRGAWRWIVVAVAAGFAAVDITENFLIDAVLDQRPPEDQLVTLASTLTQVSWVLLIMLALTVAGVVVRDFILTGRTAKP
ncbi:hypothetical protein [Nesterenkonia alkaliphila]|uniref:DUF2269 family protein n=1 Tax=Nesterenkonia alkaliphila TaxID=1463631 RepID=A0A7K1UHX9_9MICC|nr:hypothetical protein [Nesterenkonia alkaliphila]MVT25984.1 hypothetical protein [Nesterenkonia alkaliphila]